MVHQIRTSSLDKTGKIKTNLAETQGAFLVETFYTRQSRFEWATRSLAHTAHSVHRLTHSLRSLPIGTVETLECVFSHFSTGALFIWAGAVMQKLPVIAEKVKKVKWMDG